MSRWEALALVGVFAVAIGGVTVVGIASAESREYVACVEYHEPKDCR